MSEQELREFKAAMEKLRLREYFVPRESYPISQGRGIPGRKRRSVQAIFHGCCCCIIAPALQLNGEFAYAPYEWAAKAIEAYRRHRADRIIAEINNGGGMVKATIPNLGRGVGFKLMPARRGKMGRRE